MADKNKAVKRAPVEKPGEKPGEYPKWITGPLGPMVVESAAQEAGVLSGDLKLERVEAESGGYVRVVA